MLHRKGTTLMEVLIAIFVMGIGLMSIMSLFPLGALTMARAVRDDRTAHAAGNAKSIAIAKNIPFNSASMVFRLLTNAEAELPVTSRVFADAPPNGPGYPVFVDPLGFSNYSPVSGSRDWIAPSAVNQKLLRRTTLDFVVNDPSGQALLKWCTLLDDMTFDPASGSPSRVSGNIDRANSVSWAWMLRRPNVSVPTCCEVSVVIYNQRPLGVGGLLSAKEVAYKATVDLKREPWNPTTPSIVPSFYATAPRRSLLTLKWDVSTPPPNLSTGDWILEATPNPKTPAPPFLPGNASFHRVVNVGDVMLTGDPLFPKMMDIELAQPLAAPLPPATPQTGPPGFPYPEDTRVIVVMEGVVDVIRFGPIGAVK